jgi:cytochrome c biogenesis protein CcdA
VLHLLALVLSIGIADGINPTSIGPALYLASEQSPRRNVLRFAAGYVVVLLVGGLILTLGPGRAILAFVPRPSLTTRYILETVAGVAMLIGSALLWSRRKQLANRQHSAEQRAPHRPPLLLGATISAVELPTAFPYFAAIVAIVGSGLNIGQQVVLVAIYDACFILPLLAIVIVLARAGERAVHVLTEVREYMQRHLPVLAAGLALIAGLLVTTLGVTGLELHAGGGAGSISRGVRHILTHLH